MFLDILLFDKESNFWLFPVKLNLNLNGQRFD